MYHTDVPAKSMRVLVVEDETVTRTAMKALLTAYGFDVVAMASAEEALRVVPGVGSPFVALIDLDLPGMNGAELLRRLRAMRPESRAVILTAASLDKVRELFG